MKLLEGRRYDMCITSLVHVQLLKRGNNWHCKLWLRHLGNLDKPHLVYLVWGSLLESFCLP